ncbi:MAG: type II toxin-antitoxin system RelE/ParE family toxin [Cyanobacteria bacterium P01_E01_bin.42]
MSKKIFIRPQASQDIDEHFEYIARYNFDTALKFFDATRQTCARLAIMPGIGSVYPLQNPSLVDLRKWPIKDFENYLIFYLFNDEILDIIRILHGARNIEMILENQDI